MDNLEFLDGEPSDDAVRPETGAARDEQGRFAPKETEPAESAAKAEPEPPVAEPAPEPTPDPASPPPGHVPLSVVLDEREKRREAEARLKRIEEQQRRAEPVDLPPEQQHAQRLETIHLNMSERFARKEHGDEVVDKARDAALERFQTDPLYYQQVMSQPDPYEFVVREYKQSQALSALNDPNKLDAFLKWQAAQASAPLAPAPQAQAAPQQSNAPPPRSLASQPSAGGTKPGSQPVGEGVAFESVFKD